MEKERKMWVLLLSLIVLAAGLLYFSPYGIQDRSALTFRLDINNISNSPSLIILDDGQLSTGVGKDLKEGDIVMFSFDDFDYYFKVLSLSDSRVSIGITGKDLAVLFSSGDSEKIDLNNDNIYDISLNVIISKGSVRIHFQKISEPIGVIDSLSMKVDGALTQMNEASKRESVLIFILILVMFLILVFYFVNVYLLPGMRMRKAKEREEPEDVFDMLVKEFENNKNDKKKAKGLYNRAKHLYSYLDDSMKKDANSRLKKMERYIN